MGLVNEWKDGRSMQLQAATIKFYIRDQRPNSSIKKKDKCTLQMENNTYQDNEKSKREKSQCISYTTKKKRKKRGGREGRENAQGEGRCFHQVNFYYYTMILLGEGIDPIIYHITSSSHLRHPKKRKKEQKNKPQIYILIDSTMRRVTV